MSIKICHVTTIDMSLRHLLLNQLQSMAADGYEVVGVSAEGPDVAAIESAGIRHIPVPMTRRLLTPVADARSLWRLYRIFRRERFTIVHTHTPKPGLLGQVAARLAGVPIVVNTVHGFYFHDGMNRVFRRLLVASERFAARCSDTILSQNREDAATAKDEGIGSPDDFHIIGNGIDVEHFDPNAVARENVETSRRELGIEPHHRVVGFVGRLVEEKGLLELFEALSIVRRSFPDVRLLVVGAVDRHKTDALAPSAARRFGVDDITIFAGHRHDMPEMYAQMDVLALPSHREGFPRSPMEASAMGVPSVVTDIRGCREAVEDGVNGLLTPVKEPVALAQALSRLLRDERLAGEMRTRARAMALERFDERLVFERVKCHYRRLLRSRGFSIPNPRTRSIATPAS